LSYHKGAYGKTWDESDMDQCTNRNRSPYCLNLNNQTPHGRRSGSTF